jgi:ABC-2 type transport system ATP-binding protein
MSAPPQDETVIAIEGLAKTFRIGFFRKRVEAVRNVTFDVRRGEVFGLVGPNGAGKTTTLKMLLGLIRPDAGTATIHGIPAQQARSRARVGFLPETPHFYDYLKAPELLRYFAELYRMDPVVARRRIPMLLELVGLQDAGDKQLRKFSKGMLQRVGLAQALLPDSDLVILDEPQSGLDPLGRREVRRIIESLRDEGKTILFSSHILPDVEQICDRVAIMAGGEVRKVGRVDELVDFRIRDIEVVLVSDAACAEQLATWAQRRIPEPAGTVRYVLGPDADLDGFVRAAHAGGAQLVSVTRHRERLEDVFVAAATAGGAP